MNKSKYWGIGVLIVLFIGTLFWWSASNTNGEKDPLNKFATYLYNDDGILYWFDITNRNGEVEGLYYQRVIKEEIGQEPFLEENKYPLICEKTAEGYEFTIYNEDSTSFDARLVNDNLFVQERGEEDHKVYKPVDEKELHQYIKRQQQQLQMAVDQAEENEQNRLNNFFSDLSTVYGYVYTSENGKLQLFIKIDEALHEGELAGSLLMMEAAGPKNNFYKETNYELNGITDGLMVEFFTTVDGNDTKLEGNFHQNAKGFDLTFWTTDETLSFHAVTENEYKQIYKQFKKKTEGER